MPLLSGVLTEDITAPAQQEERERIRLQHVCTPPIGEPSPSPDPFSSHSSALKFSGLRHVPFGDEVHRNHPHHNQPNRTTLTHQTLSQHKRHLRSRGSRQRRRITHRAHRAYPGWRTALHPPPTTALFWGKGSPARPHTKPLYGLTCRTPSHRQPQPKSSSSLQQRPPESNNTATATADAIAFDTFFHELSSSNTRHHRTTPHPTTFAPTHSPHPITDNNGSSATTCAKEHIPEHTGSKHTSANSQRQDQTRHTSTAAAATQRSLLEHHWSSRSSQAPLTDTAHAATQIELAPSQKPTRSIYD